MIIFCYNNNNINLILNPTNLAYNPHILQFQLFFKSNQNLQTPQSKKYIIIINIHNSQQKNKIKMDIFLGMMSIVKDMNSIDKQYKNLNLQLKYTLDKASRIFNKTDPNIQKLAFVVLKTKIQQGQKLTRKLDQLFTAESLAIKDKIRLSMPFSQTKSEIINVIETLEKVINDIKEQLTDDNKIQKTQSKEGGVKRKISYNNSNKQENLVKTSQVQLTKKQIDQHIQEIYQFGPTIKQDQQYIYSENKNKQHQIQFTIFVHGSEDFIKIIQVQNLDKSKTLITQKQVPHQKILYTVARMNFQKCYAKVKAITKDIDRISTKAHFHFVFKKTGQITNPSQCHKVSSSKKLSKVRANGSQKQDQDVFFSFPVDQKINHNFEFKLLAKKEDPSKTMYRISGEEWVKVQQAQIQIVNGDKIAAFINPQTKKPSIYFELGYDFTHN